MVDKSVRAKQIIDSLRKSAGGSSIPPSAGGTNTESRPTTEEVLGKIENRQVQVVEAISDALSTVSEVVAELQASVVEGECTRRAVRKQTREVQATRKLVSVLSYVTTGVVLAACVIIVILVAWQVRIVQGQADAVQDIINTLAAVDVNTAATQKVILKQAEAHAKQIEASSAMTPQAEEAALEAAIDVQEEAAETQIKTAQRRKQMPPPEAQRALKEAKAKKAQLRGPRQLVSE